MPEGRAFIDNASPPGSWRGAIEPNGWCRGCGQRDCACPDAIYQGVAPPLNGARQHDADASGASASLHSSPSSSEAQHNHG